MEIVYESTTHCVIWGMFCETKVTAKPRQKPLSAKESEDVWNYIKFNTLKNFKDDNGQYIQYLEEEAEKYAGFLPAPFKADHQKILDNPSTPPDQLVPHDAFNPGTYELWNLACLVPEI